MAGYQRNGARLGALFSGQWTACVFKETATETETVTEEVKAAVDGGSKWRQRTGGDQELTTTPEASGYATRVEMDKVAITGPVGT